MKNSSLDAEPPSKFTREKEVRKNGNLNQLILSLKNEKIKSKYESHEKNIEKRVILDFQDYIFDLAYLKTNNGFTEEISATTKSVTFKNNLDTNPNQIASGFNYSQRISTTEITDKKPSNFYTITSSYYFTPQVREENKKEELSPQFREQEIKEPIYVLHNLDEEPKQES
jgi:hypothetical protein